MLDNLENNLKNKHKIIIMSVLDQGQVKGCLKRQLRIF